MTVASFKDCVDVVKRTGDELYEEYLAALSYREFINNQNIHTDILIIMDKIKEDPDNFSYIDFSLLTNLDALELLRVSDCFLNMEDKKLFRSIVSNFRKLKVLNTIEINNLMDMSYTINVDGELINVLDYDKEKILEFLTENEIPVTINTFRYGLTRLYKSQKNKNI